jgi:glycosyltransferase involved in cell wall biosynthesis
MAAADALSRVREAPFILDALAAAERLAVEAGDGIVDLRQLGQAAFDSSDQLTAIAGVHALAQVFDDEADSLLSELLSHPSQYMREHAAWAIGARLPRLDAVGRLVGVVTSGGFPGMVAQRTLERWARPAPDHVALALEGALAAGHDVATRARLAETIGLVPGPIAERAVLQLAADEHEATDVRAVAVAALGDRVSALEASEPLLRRLARRGDAELGAAAELALYDCGLLEVARPSDHDEPAGLTVAQLFLHADLDRELSRAGAGDNGGIATLLVRLGDALSETDTVARVVTMSRGSGPAAVAGLEADERHLLVPIPLRQRSSGTANSWPARVSVERGVRRILRKFAPVDVLHLRMADVGSLAAQAVAQRLGVPTVFSLAPDPHAVIHALDMTGALRRDNFGDVDASEHYWFRARLVQRLAGTAEHSVLFPRPQLRNDLQELLGIDIEVEPTRYTVVPEGIDISLADAARGEQVESEPVPAVRELIDVLAALPGHRHGLPLALSVGRLHRVKGMATVVEAWASDPDLWSRCNLVIVGGDLEEPSSDERDQLDRIAEVLRDHPEAAEGLVLAGHRPNGVVARWLAAAHHGSVPHIGPGGVYICGSLKEEFGLALVEALAAGLPVVAPAGGGPATFVRPGDTGVLVDTRDPDEVAAGLHAALDIADVPGRADRAVRTVRECFTVQAMAASLSEIYAGVGALSRDLRDTFS